MHFVSLCQKLGFPFPIPRCLRCLCCVVYPSVWFSSIKQKLYGLILAFQQSPIFPWAFPCVLLWVSSVCGIPQAGGAISPHFLLSVSPASCCSTASFLCTHTLSSQAGLCWNFFPVLTSYLHSWSCTVGWWGLHFSHQSSIIICILSFLCKSVAGFVSFLCFV